MSTMDHQEDARITEAAMWLSEQYPTPQPVVPIIKARFGLSALEACIVCERSQRMRTLRSAAA